MSETATTATVTCITYQPVKVGGATKLKAKGYQKPGLGMDGAREYFEAKLAKWTERAEAGGKIDILIPHMSFRAYMPNGFSIYYEIV
jgi:hypothetical protein